MSTKHNHDDAAASASAGAAAPAPAPAAAPAPAISIGRIVTVNYPGEQNHDGESVVAAIVSKVNEDGSINAHVFNPNGNGQTFVTGLRSVAERDALPDTDPARNLAAWDWPART